MDSINTNNVKAGTVTNTASCGGVLSYKVKTKIDYDRCYLFCFGHVCFYTGVTGHSYNSIIYFTTFSFLQQKTGQEERTHVRFETGLRNLKFYLLRIRWLTFTMASSTALSLVAAVDLAIVAPGSTL